MATVEDVDYLRNWLYEALIPNHIKDRFLDILEEVEEQDD